MNAAGDGWLRVLKVSMNWVYDRVVRHKSVNYHIWSASDDGRTVFALTRTSALEPRNVAAYTSMEEVFWRTGVEVTQSPEDAIAPYRPHQRAAVGLSRTSDGWAEVDYGHRTGAVPRELYLSKGYEPSFDSLPLEKKSREPIPRFGHAQRQLSM